MVGSLKILDYDLKENVMSVQVSFNGILLNILLIKNNFAFLAFCEKNVFISLHEMPTTLRLTSAILLKDHVFHENG